MLSDSFIGHTNKRFDNRLNSNAIEQESLAAGL